MSRLRVVPIVEGHGEVQAIRTLLQRIWTDLLGGEHLEVSKPIRFARSKLVQKEGLRRAVNLAVLRLKEDKSGDPGCVLILVDANGDCPAHLAPDLLTGLTGLPPGLDISCVVAKVEYETWFVASAASLHDYLDVAPPSALPERPEETGAGKAWIQRRFRGVKYSETIDQPRLMARMDLRLCRDRSPSFDKLCRELDRRLGQEHQTTR